MGDLPSDKASDTRAGLADLDVWLKWQEERVMSILGEVKFTLTTLQSVNEDLCELQEQVDAHGRAISDAREVALAQANAIVEVQARIESFGNKLDVLAREIGESSRTVLSD